MLTENHFHNSILLLSYLITNADGILDDSELEAIGKICKYEKIEDAALINFVNGIPSLTEREVYEKGLEEITICSNEEKIRVFAWLHRISEADGNVHVKEVRFLLYSIKKAGIEFEDVLKKSTEFPPLT